MRFNKNVYLTLVILILTIISVGAQNRNHLIAETGLARDNENVGLKYFRLGFERDIGLGINAILYYTDSAGGAKILSKISPVGIGELRQEGSISNDNGNIIIDHFQSRSISIGIKKYIQLFPKGFMSISILGSYNRVNQSKLGNIKYDEQGDLALENIRETYSSYTTFGGEINAGYQFQITNYLSIGLKGGYRFNPNFYHLGIQTIASF